MVKYLVPLLLIVAAPVQAQSVELSCSGDKVISQHQNGEEISRIEETGSGEYRVDIVGQQVQSISIRRDGAWSPDWTICGVTESKITCKDSAEQNADYIVQLDTSTKELVQVFRQKKDSGSGILVYTLQVMNCQ